MQRVLIVIALLLLVPLSAEVWGWAVVIASIGMVAVALFLVLAIILLLANLGAFLTKIEQATTVFINTGDSLLSIWPNIAGFKMSEAEDLEHRHWLIPEPDENLRLEALFRQSSPWTKGFQKWLWKKFGVRGISLFWPHIHRHTFDIRSRKRLLEGADVEQGTPLKGRVVETGDKKGTTVDSLLFLVPRPVYLDGLQLAGDNARINMLLLPIYRQVIPTLPVYDLKGDFFTQLDAALEAAMVDLCSTHRVAVYKSGERQGQFAADFYRPPHTKAAKEKFGRENNGQKYEDLFAPSPLTYSHWLKLSKTGPNSPVEEYLRHLNVSLGYYNDLKDANKTELIEYLEKLVHGKPKKVAGQRVASEVPSGIIHRFGFALVSLRTVDWEPHPDTRTLALALLAKETEFYKAEGVRAEADGARDSIKSRAEGEANRFEILMKALVDKGVDPNIAADVVKTQLRMEGVRDSNLGTYVEGGASASVMIPAASPSSPTPATTPTTT